MASKAQDVGGKLLGEVDEGNLSEVLQALWTEALHENLFNVPSIDRLVDIFQQNAHSTARRRPTILELASSSPAAGKTHLLYLMIAAAVLPTPSIASTPTREPGAVIVLDTDNRFNISRLAHVMSSHCHSLHPNSVISPAVEAFERSETPIAILQALRHVHIFRPQSLSSLIATLTHLPTYLLDFSCHHSAHRPLRFLIIDSATSFFWPARYEYDTASPPGHVPVPTHSPYATLVAALHSAQVTLRCPVVTTTCSLSSRPATGPRGAEALRPLLPLVWQQCVTVRLAVRREPVRKFHTELSLRQCEVDREQRQEVVDRARFWAEVDAWGDEAWAPEVRAALRRDGRGFGFVIHAKGVSIDG